MGNHRRGAPPVGRHRRQCGERIGNADAIHHVPDEIGAQHHELAQREVDDAGDAEGQGHAEREDAIQRADDDPVHRLPDQQLQHEAGGVLCC